MLAQKAGVIEPQRHIIRAAFCIEGLFKMPARRAGVALSQRGQGQCMKRIAMSGRQCERASRFCAPELSEIKGFWFAQALLSAHSISAVNAIARPRIIADEL